MKINDNKTPMRTFLQVDQLRSNKTQEQKSAAASSPSKHESNQTPQQDFVECYYDRSAQLSLLEQDFKGSLLNVQA